MQSVVGASKTARDTAVGQAEGRVDELSRANQVLQFEVAAHQQAEEALRAAYAELEQRMNEHTTALVATNQQLQQEMAARRYIEDQLQYQANLVEAIPDAVISTDMAFKIKSWNRAAETIYGWKADEVIGRPTAQILGTEYLPGEREVLAALLVETGRWSGEVIQRHKDGTPINIHSSVILIRNDRGTPIEAVAINQDITSRKETRYSLAWESGLNAVVAELSSLLISSAALDEISWLVLNHAKRLTGSTFGFVGHIAPETGHLVSSTLTRDIWAGVCEVADKNVVFHEFKGLWGWVLQNRHPLLTNNPLSDPRSTGVPAGHIPIHRFLAVPALADGVLVGEIALANPERDYEERDLALLERLATLYALAVQRSQTEKQLHEYADRLEQKVSQKVLELEQERAKVVQTGKLAALGEMATGVAHELNQPLTAMLFDAEYLEAAILKGKAGKQGAPVLNTDEVLEISRNLIADIGRCRRIIDHLRDFSRASEQTLGKVDLNQSIDNAFILVGERLRLHNVAVQQQLTPDLPMILGNPYKLEQVFLNLIGNAEYATAQKAATLQAEASPDLRSYTKTLRIATTLEGDWVVAQVYDNGCGIPSAAQEHIFEPFFTTKPVGDGTGLGLSISYGIITEVGGEITFETAVGAGTTFKLRFPVYKER